MIRKSVLPEVKPEIHVRCRSHDHYTYETSAEEVVVTFRSDSSVVDSGFSVSFLVEDCGELNEVT